MKPQLVHPFLCAVMTTVLLGSGCYVSSADSMLTGPTTTSGVMTGAAVIGTTWVAIEVDGVSAGEAPVSDLTFESERRIAGSSGCNRYVAELNPSPEPLVRAGGIGGTRMVCDPPIMEREHRFVNALDSTRTYRVHGDSMYFYDGPGRTRIHFRRATRPYGARR